MVFYRSRLPFLLVLRWFLSRTGTLGRPINGLIVTNKEAASTSFKVWSDLAGDRTLSDVATWASWTSGSALTKLNGLEYNKLVLI